MWHAPLLSYEQANPQVPAFEHNFQNTMQGLFGPRQAAQQLQGGDLNNYLKSTEARYAPQMTQADLAYKQAQTPYLKEQTEHQRNINQFYAPEAKANIEKLNLGNAQARRNPYGNQELDTLFQLGLIGPPGGVQGGAQGAGNYGQGGQLPVTDNQRQALQNLGQQNPDMGWAGERLGQIFGGGIPSQPLPGLGGQIQQAMPPGPAQISALDYLRNKNLTNSPFVTPEQKLAYEGQKIKIETAAKGIEKAWEKKQIDLGKEVEGSFDTQNITDNLVNSYQKLSELQKGPLAGNAPAITAAAQEVDNLSNQLIQSAANELQHGGRVTNQDLVFLKSLKLGRYMAPETMRRLKNFTDAKATRKYEKQAFMNQAEDIEGLKPGQADQLWLNYQQHYPIFNYKNGNIIEENRGKYDPYLSEEAVEDLKKGRPFAPNIDAFNRLPPDQKIKLYQQQRGKNG